MLPGPHVKHPRRAAAILAGALLAAAAIAGCSKYPIGGAAFLNQRPWVELTSAPVNSSDTTWYSYRINWSGGDPDGRVARFEYAVDPPRTPDADTLWISTTKNEMQVFFRATHAYFDPKRGWRSNDFHTFVIRAVDNAGAVSAPKSRSFYSFTVAPTTYITSPLPTKLLSRQLATALRINWVGRDEDGVFTQKPVQYKYRLFREDDHDFPFPLLQSDPDSLRRYFSAHSWAGWDSTSADTTFVRYTDLTPGISCVFAVVGFDEAGAYSPDFSLESNMLLFTPGFANTLGPRFTVFNEFFTYTYPSGGVSLDPLAWIEIDVPANLPLTVNWFARPPEGATMEWYSWKIDGDYEDQTQRTNESTDWYHWSRRSSLVNSCTIGPYAGGEDHFLYVAGMDNVGLPSLAIVHFHVVAPTFDKPLLVVDDTRLSPDRYVGGSRVPLGYANKSWPTAAELDTFLFARGGFPWRGPQGIDGNLPLSRPGVFEGYSYDTLGTRTGAEFPNTAVPLALLGRYRHVLWITDPVGLTTAYGPLSLIDPVATLRWMSAPGRLNTLSTYMYAGGRVWMVGGTSSACTLLPFNATGSRDNDSKYGPGHAPIFSASAGELAPGRLMWDFGHWRSEIVTSRANTLPKRSPAAIGGWSHPGWKYAGTMTAPDYAKLPPLLRRRSLALGDSLPPTRTNATEFYSTALWPPTEYLTDDNRILEDFDPSPLAELQGSALDTLYELQGGALATLYTGRKPVTMTYYHGVEGPPFVFSGFDLWTWSRRDIVGLVDFVLQDIWGLQRSAPLPVARGAVAPGVPAPSAGRDAGDRRVVIPGARRR